MDDFISEKGKASKAKVETLMREVTPSLIEYYERTEFPKFMVRRLILLHGITIW